MTQDIKDRTRDELGRFAHEQSNPETELTEVYFEDTTTTGDDFDIDAFYDVQVADDTEMTVTENLDAIDEYFAQPEPDFERMAANVDPSAWENTPF